LRWAASSAGSEVPAEGVSTYSAGNTIGTATVACVISSAGSSAQSKTDGAGGSAGCTTSALTNGQPYTYKVFQRDTRGNYDVGVLMGTVTPVALISVSGTVYSDEGVTTATSTLKLVLNGATAYTTSTAADGTFTFSGVTQPSAGQVMTLWMDNGDATRSGAVVTRYSGSGNITGLNIYTKRLIVRHEDAGPLSNTNINVCTKTLGLACADADLHFDVSAGNLTVDNDWMLYLWPGKTFTPGGAVTLSPGATAANPGGDLKWGSSTSTLNIATNALSVGGDWNNAAGGTFTASAGQTTTFTATATGFTINPGGQSFQNVTFNGIGGSWSMSANTTVNNLTITNGTLTAPSGTLTVNGDFTNSGTFTHNNGTVVFQKTSATTIPALSYYNLEVKPGANSITHTLGAGTITVAGNFTAGNGVNTGVIIAGNTNSTTLSVTGNFTIAASTNFQANSTQSFVIGGNYTNNGTFTHNSGTLTFNGTTQQTLSGNLTGASAFSTLVFANNSGTDPQTSPSIIVSSSISASTSTITTASAKIRFQANATSTFTNINWNGGGTGTRVALRSSTAGTPWNLVVTGSQTVLNVDAKDSNACGGNNITATDVSNLDSGGNSCWNFATLPGTPGTPTYTNVSTSTLTVNWTSATGADYYKLERTTSTAPTGFIQITTTTLLAYNDSGLATSTEYWYKVRATNAAGDGPYSATSSVTTLSGGLPATGELTSVVFDTTGSANGPAYNSIMWKGTLNGGAGRVRFQFASADSADGPWNFIGGDTCSSGDWYDPGGPNMPAELKCAPQNHDNKRYFRYKVQLCSASDCSSSGTISPTVDDVIVSWSP